MTAELVPDSGWSATEVQTTGVFEVSVQRGSEMQAARNDLDTPSGLTNSLDHYLAGLDTPLLTAEEEVELAKRIETGINAEDLLDGFDPNTDLVPPDHLESLLLAISDGQAAKKHMISANLRLVVSMVKRYRSNLRDPLAFELIQEGNLGLIRAVEGFDYTKGYKFSTFGTWWIRKNIIEALAHSEGAAPLSTYMFEQLKKLQKIHDQLEQEHGREPTEQELADAMSMKLPALRKLRSTDGRTTSLDKRVGKDESDTLGDYIPAEASSDPAEVLSTDWLNAVVADILDFPDLTSWERTVILGRLGFNGRIMESRELAAEHGRDVRAVHPAFRSGIRKLQQPHILRLLRKQLYE